MRSDKIKEMLVGDYFSQFTLGDSFAFEFSKCHLIAQNIELEQEGHLLKKLQEIDPTFAQVPAPDNLPKALICAATQMQKVSAVHLDTDKSLLLEFENGFKWTCTVDTPIVDWQWALNRDGGGPYMDLTVGCFFAGEVELGRPGE